MGLKSLLDRAFRGKVPNDELKKVLKDAEKWDKLKVVVGNADKETLESSAVIEIGEYDTKGLHEAMKRYIENYGVMPKEIYSMPFEEIEAYMRAIMLQYKQAGISTLAEIESRIGERKSFIGPHSKGIKENGEYRIYVNDELIYSESEAYFDSKFKRFQAYSEIQHIIAKNIYKKDLALIRKEAKKEARRLAGAKPRR
jgi:hypothetical protein